MYYSQAIDDYNVSIFRLFILRTLDGFDGYKQEIQVVISEAKSLLNEEKTVYEINRELFSLILYLKNKDTGFLRNLNIDNVQKEDYKELLKIIEKQESESSLQCMYNY
ncbi:hypothetical protein E2605_09705 [Dysgonomonas capnocytophagoides]|uniref:Uncharacterized protein n=1 Tax=Dysgonomonas capnocytophagoides TaxID=45254 RepID=A0A4Y8L2C8_9BACT|nr:hypothetical protein [Dysgonomonas capnocytophagoides]TFD96431.1 hypothetical protein E2605_09705 [Dysgonomonas capnocytophagoides]